jgi:hypothetical protein
MDNSQEILFQKRLGHFTNLFQQNYQPDMGLMILRSPFLILALAFSYNGGENII